jgi:phage-related protein (TIGR01555 family)
MAKKQKKKSLPVPVVQNDLIENGFSDAIGFTGGSGFPGIGGGNSFPGGPTYQQIESSTGLFENLRWYLVSNFRQLISQLFAEIGLVKTIVCVPVDDGLRGGILLKSKQLDEDQIKQLQLEMKRKEDLNTAGWGAKWNRAYGGAGILILVDDQDPEDELDLESIGPDTEVEYRAVDMWELFWDKQNDEGYDPAIQEQDFEFYNYYGESIHKSRVLRLKGIEAPSFIRPRLRGWGLSVVEDLVRSLNQYLKATDLSFEVLDEFKIDVYKIKNLVNTLLSPTGTNKVKERIQATNWQKNYQHAIVMDSEDDYAQKQLSFAGLADAQCEIRMQVAADMRMPITKLFGTSVSGGFQTDQNDMENYNSMVESDVRAKLEGPLLRMAEIRSQSLFGFIPDDLELEWKPLRELSAVDQETVKTAKYARVSDAKAKGEITTLEYRDACNKGNLFDVQLDTTEDGLSEDPQLADVMSGDSATENSPKGEYNAGK